MKKAHQNSRKGIVVLISLLFLLAGGCGGKSKAKDKTEKSHSSKKNSPITAREALNTAKNKGKSWKADARIVSIKSFAKANTQGRSSRWVVVFNSPSTRKALAVHVVGRGEILQEIGTIYRKREPLPRSWIDSPQIVKRAMKEFPPGASKFWMAISTRSNARTTWYVKCKHGKGSPYWVEIDALSGKLLNTWRGW